jgi:hypothetical protein
MEFAIIVLVLVAAYVLFEYRFRKPDEIILRETRSGVGTRRGRFYPRHFSMPVARTPHSFTQTIDASAKGNLEIRVKLAVTVAPSGDNLPALIRAGGWTGNAVTRAAEELQILILGYLKGYTELHEMQDLTSDGIRDHLLRRLSEVPAALGLEIIALTIAAFDPVNPQIAEALRQREHARILEQAEALNQRARITAADARIKADDEIARMENSLELRKFELKRAQFEKQSALASQRAEHELQLKRMELEFDKAELRMLKENPELLLLTPQAARLAEASQSLKNAHTVVSLSPADGAPGAELLGLFQAMVQGALEAYRKRKEK